MYTVVKSGMYWLCGVWLECVGGVGRWELDTEPKTRLIWIGLNKGMTIRL